MLESARGGSSLFGLKGVEDGSYCLFGLFGRDGRVLEADLEREKSSGLTLPARGK